MRLTFDNLRINLDDIRLTVPSNWSPRDSAYVWWDASDSSSIVLSLSGGNNIVQLTDKGSLGIDLTQEVESLQPTFNSVQQNGYSTISFDKTAQEHLSGNITSYGLTDIVLAIACKPKSLGSKYNAVFSYSGDTKDFQFDAGDGSYFYGYFRSTGYTDNFFDNVDSVNVPQMLSIAGDTNTGELKGYKNGVHKWTDPNYIGWDNTDVWVRIASNRNGGRFISMDFYELIVAPVEEYEEVHKYLKAKWNI